MYRTFLRSATNWREFASAKKTEVDTGLTLQEAREQCEEYNNNRTALQEEQGTKMEFEEE